MTQDPTPAPSDVALVVRALAAEDVHWGYDHGFARNDGESASFATAVVAALTEAGRLLPTDADPDVHAENQRLRIELDQARQQVRRAHVALGAAAACTVQIGAHQHSESCGVGPWLPVPTTADKTTEEN